MQSGLVPAGRQKFAVSVHFAVVVVCPANLLSEEGVEKTDEQVIIHLRAEQLLETKVDV